MRRYWRGGRDKVIVSMQGVCRPQSTTIYQDRLRESAGRYLQLVVELERADMVVFRWWNSS